MFGLKKAVQVVMLPALCVSLLAGCTQNPAEIIMHNSVEPRQQDTQRERLKSADNTKQQEPIITETPPEEEEPVIIVQKEQEEIAKPIIENKKIIDTKPTQINPYKITVNKGDTLYSISRANDVEIRQMIEINRLRPPYLLKVGQNLRLPKPVLHIVKPGDTIYSISRVYGVDMSSLTKANRLVEPYNLTPDQQIRLTAKTNYTMQAEKKEAKPKKTIIAKAESKTSVPTPTLKTTNNYPSPALKPAIGKKKPVKISAAKSLDAPIPSLKPGGTKLASINPKKTYKRPPSRKIPTKKQKVAASKGFIWPVKGKIVSRFGPKKGGLYNDGINIKAPEGTGVRAVANGEVVYSGNALRGYGNLLLVKHPNGYLSAYAHNKKLLVKKGDTVKQGQIISEVGSTGNINSSQLHFSIRKGRKAVNPERYIS